VEDREAARGANRREREASEEAQTLGNRRRTRPYTSTLEQKTNGTKTMNGHTRTDPKRRRAHSFQKQAR
jgi:hypothetical protein